ncbi:cytochrome C assembly protein [Opitutaceae bacterium TAV5]|nr:cytochrome C assembly protein [Opitutaceae bacterium TAV5]
MTPNYWQTFPAHAAAAGLAWLLCIAAQCHPATRSRRLPVTALALLGGGILAAFAAGLWLHLGRPPMRTLGETRLWYAVFTPAIGAFLYHQFRYRWLLNYSLGMAVLFVVICLLRPDSYNKALMPALQSVWFVPHVLVYLFSYAIFAVSSGIAVFGLVQTARRRFDPASLELANRLVYLGFAFLSLGLLFGALWAKEAWGHYWTWDPKETWAMLTWLGYLLYIHIRHRHPEATRASLRILALAFVVLLLCWFGVNYMPSATQSVHTYTQ